MKKAVYAGSFDPPTYGHMDIIARASKLVDELIVAVAVNPHKKSLLSLEERNELLKALTKDMPNVRVEFFTGLLVRFVERENADAIIRGFRAVSDFEYELQLAQGNSLLSPQTETVFLVSNAKYSFISSTFVKEAAFFGGEIGDMVPELSKQAVLRKMGVKNEQQSV
ncbi:pantetheine-phosphate adenylyltransferase [Lachnospiraceae bacterium oral taxon 500]|nr:pantetheine-phosphate adenylyltransferase [Lachnospiraceae bacterium oral taxon 500]